MNADLEAMAATLVSSGEYRVQRKLVPRRQITPPNGEKKWLGICLDIETTGLDPISDEIIELAMVPFTYGFDGRIYDILEPFSRFLLGSSNDPANFPIFP
ncbi:MAG: hypothetical protein F8N36_14220 [Desulfovibrio sp.]|uniref:exonuclease domain-containing protein n=1 Tax=Desulfovibrio sp. TaxID=885 RepID=UPI00135E594C|nr:exonuclease domain-containing protein [Desulfovibrio sp.]MTJ93994.1 hypothetical protein [Desulfovibrio sp.]